MLSFTVEVDIDKPRDAVVDLMHPDHLPKWSKNFVKLEHIAGPLWEAGSKYEIHMNINGYSLVVIETFIDRNLPEYFSCTFEHKTMWQSSENWLEVLPNGGTRWVSKQDIEIITFGSKIISWLMPGYYKSYVRRHMEAFKVYAEAS